MGRELSPTTLGTAAGRTTSPRLVLNHHWGNWFPAPHPRGKGYKLHTSAREQPATEPACRAKPLAAGFGGSSLAWALGAHGLKDSLQHGQRLHTDSTDWLWIGLCSSRCKVGFDFPCIGWEIFS